MYLRDFCQSVRLRLSELNMPFHDNKSIIESNPITQRRIALVIGNARYAHATPLSNPVNDAEAMAAVFARLGFDVVKGLDLDLAAMGDAHAEYEAKLRSKPDAAVLFYAGHGLQVRGKNYLVPVDAAIAELAHLASRALLLNDILEPMTEGAAASLIFLDACRDNPFSRNLARSLGDAARSTSARAGLAKIDKVAGTFIAYATAPDTVAYDGKDEANSPFTRALLRHIQTPGLSVSDMMIDVRNSVLQDTAGRQEPWDQSSLRSRFYFVPKHEDPAQTTPAVLSGAANEWAAINSTASLSVLAAFRERYPDPPWSTYADLRMAELREADDMLRRRTEAERQRRSSREPQQSSQNGHYGADGEPAPPPVHPLTIEVGVRGQTQADRFIPGHGKSEWFSDIPNGPEMVAVPAGSCYLPAALDRTSAATAPANQRRTHLAAPLAVGRFPVTVSEFAKFVDATGHVIPNGMWTYEGVLRRTWKQRANRSLLRPGFAQTPRHPVVGVNWNDARAYASWLAKITKHPYRLLTEHEWWYAIGQWREVPVLEHGEWSELDQLDGTVPVDALEAGPWGVYKQVGRVWEWSEDTWQGPLPAAPATSQSFSEGVKLLRELRGGVLHVFPEHLRHACQTWATPLLRLSIIGFRVARTLL